MGDRLTDERLRLFIEEPFRMLTTERIQVAREVLELRAENMRLRERCGELEPLRSGVHVVEP